MRSTTQAEGFVLAGGRSSRMGQDKALLPFGGGTLLDLALDKLSFPGLWSGTPRIVASRPDLSRFAPIVEDIHSGCGPLSGIEAALAATSQPFNLVLAVDLPLVPAGFLQWMLRRAEITQARLTLPKVNGRPQPLCAVYHRDLLAPITCALGQGRDYKVLRVLTRAATAASEVPAIDAFDIELIASTYPEFHDFSPLPVYRWFYNCNTPEDLAFLAADARQMLSHRADGARHRTQSRQAQSHRAGNR